MKGHLQMLQFDDLIKHNIIPTYAHEQVIYHFGDGN